MVLVIRPVFAYWAVSKHTSSNDSDSVTKKYNIFGSFLQVSNTHVPVPYEQDKQ